MQVHAVHDIAAIIIVKTHRSNHGIINSEHQFVGVAYQ